MAKKILIVEDDEAFYNLCSIELKLKGYDVLHVADGSLALDKVKTEAPDLVLLDIVLPGTNGLDVLQEIKANDSTKNTKVVMLTNFGSDDNVKRAIEYGAEDYIMKYNVVASELPTRLAVWLGDEENSNVRLTN